MSQKDDILLALADGPATMPQLAQITRIKLGTLQAQLSELKKRGRAVCDGIGSRDPWRLPGAVAALAAQQKPKMEPISQQPADDPTMIPGGPEPTCETAALAADEGEEPDEEMPGADAIALAVVAAARVTGEDPLRIAVPDAFVRARFPAVKALSIFFPDATWQQLGRYVGLTKLTPKVAENIPSFPWWDDVGDPAFEAAISALEAA